MAQLQAIHLWHSCRFPARQTQDVSAPIQPHLRKHTLAFLSGSKVTLHYPWKPGPNVWQSASPLLQSSLMHWSPQPEENCAAPEQLSWMLPHTKKHCVSQPKKGRALSVSSTASRLHVWAGPFQSGFEAKADSLLVFVSQYIDARSPQDHEKE